jgi:hypothetical protein
MKSPGIIYRRYRQLKRKILYEKLQESRRRIAKNCIYGKSLDIIDKYKTHSVYICLYNKDVSKGLDVCNHPEECNAYICKNSRKDIEDGFENELKDFSIRNKKYPELSTLEWVLDKSLDDAKKEPTNFVKMVIFIINYLENLIKFTVKDQKRLMSDK